jgi:hypothetical protein
MKATANHDVTDSPRTPTSVCSSELVGRLVAKERTAMSTAFKLKADGLNPVEARFVMACLCLLRPLESAAIKLGWSEPPNEIAQRLPPGDGGRLQQNSPNNHQQSTDQRGGSSLQRRG